MTSAAPSLPQRWRPGSGSPNQPARRAQQAEDRGTYADLVDDPTVRATEQVGQALTKAMEKEIEGT